MVLQEKVTVAILMATYNGAIYLEEQIKSILSQTYSNWLLYIHDDGSSDATVQIINDYCDKFPDKIVYMKDEHQHRGAADSFLWMLKQVNADYYMFADQDDVWLPNKIQNAMNIMLDLEKNNSLSIPILYHTDLVVVDSELNTISSSLWRFSHLLNIIDNPLLYSINNIVTGCTMLINKQCKNVLLFEDKDVLMHDYWILLYVLKNKGVVYSNYKADILYRQHGNNVLGCAGYSTSLKKRMLNIKRSLYYNYRIYRSVNRILGMSLFKYLYAKSLCSQKMLGKVEK